MRSHYFASLLYCSRQMNQIQPLLSESPRWTSVILRIGEKGVNCTDQIPNLMEFTF